MMTRYQINFALALAALLMVLSAPLAHAYTIGQTWRVRATVQTEVSWQPIGTVPAGMSAQWAVGSADGVVEIVGPRNGGGVWVRALGAGKEQVVVTVADAHGGTKAASVGVTVTGPAPTIAVPTPALPKVVGVKAAIEAAEPLPPELR